MKGKKARATSTKKPKIVEREAIKKYASHMPFYACPGRTSINQPTEFQMFNTEITMVEPTPE
jgi:hypothetical protein